MVEAFIARGTGVEQQITKQGRLSAKIPGKHRWICVTSYNISDTAARNLLNKNADSVHIDIENLAYYTFGCYDCEKELTRQSLHTRCHAHNLE